MIWHEISERRLDYSQVGQLGATLMFACDGGQGKADAVTAGWDIGDAQTIAGESCEVTGMDVATRDGIDYVQIRANTPDYSWWLIPGVDLEDETETDEIKGRWFVRFGTNMVPGDQVVAADGTTVDDANKPPAEKLMPQPTIFLEWRRTIEKPIPTTKAGALNMAATYAVGVGATGNFEDNPPKIAHTLKGSPPFLCISVEIEEHQSRPASASVRTATYEYNVAHWPIAIYPEGSEDTTTPPPAVP